MEQFNIVVELVDCLSICFGCKQSFHHMTNCVRPTVQRRSFIDVSVLCCLCSQEHKCLLTKCTAKAYLVHAFFLVCSNVVIWEITIIILPTVPAIRCMIRSPAGVKKLAWNYASVMLPLHWVPTVYMEVARRRTARVEHCVCV